MPLLQVPHRQMELLEEISHRRFDQFSPHSRVYRGRSGTIRRFGGFGDIKSAVWRTFVQATCGRKDEKLL